MTFREKYIYASGSVLWAGVSVAVVAGYDTGPAWPVGLVVAGLYWLAALWLHTTWLRP